MSDYPTPRSPRLPQADKGKLLALLARLLDEVYAELEAKEAQEKEAA